MLSIDGAGLESRIGGTIIACVLLSGNNHIVPFGLSLTSVEAGETVTLFMVLLKRLYPVQEFVLSDSGKAFEAGANTASYKCHGGRSWHMLKKNAVKTVTRRWRLIVRVHSQVRFTAPWWQAQLSTMPVAIDTANVHLLLLAIFDRDCAL